jgi:hypothetical protein
MMAVTISLLHTHAETHIHVEGHRHFLTSVMGKTTGVSGALPFGVATVILDCNVQVSPVSDGRELGRCLSNWRG